MPQMAITCTPRSCITRCGAVCILAVALIAAAVNLAGQAPAYSSAEWGAPGGDWASTRYSTLTRINTTNIGQLGGAWVVELPDRQVSKAPLMVKDGRMFVPTSQGTILALDPGTGQTIWTYKPETPFSGNRGVGIGEGLLFAGLRNSNVLAISQDTGQWPGRRARSRDPLARHERSARVWQRRCRCRRIAWRQFPARTCDRFGREDRQVPLEVRGGARTRQTRA